MTSSNPPLTNRGYNSNEIGYYYRVISFSLPSFVPRSYNDIDYSTVKGIILMMLQIFTNKNLFESVLVGNESVSDTRA